MHSPKKVILGITGGIAAYKTCDLVRLLKKSGHEVRVVMTRAAEDFVSVLSLATVSENPVLRSLAEGTDDFSRTAHIDLARWGDLLIVAPATANFLAKLRAGIADDALTTEALAFRGPVFVAPAMNTRMWDAAVTKENCTALSQRGIQFLGPVEGDLACGEIGAGKMIDPAEIVARVFAPLPFSGKKVLITSGPTRSYIDSVRYLTNRSSGRMGHAIARAAEDLGAEVVLVVGPVDPQFAQLQRGKVISVETGDQMLAACLPELESSDLVVAAAAVSDYGLPNPFEGKLRREGNLHLELTATVDVLAELGKRKQSGQVFLGFAAEAGEGKEQKDKGYAKIRAKNLDLLALNNVARSDIGFDVKENEIHLLYRDGKEELLSKREKTGLAPLLLGKAFALQNPKQVASREIRV